MPAPPVVRGRTVQVMVVGIVTMTMYVLLKVMEGNIRFTQTVIFHATNSISLCDGCFYLSTACVVARLPLIIASDVEENPGPVETGVRGGGQPGPDVRG